MITLILSAWVLAPILALIALVSVGEWIDRRREARDQRPLGLLIRLDSDRGHEPPAERRHR